MGLVGNNSLLTMASLRLENRVVAVPMVHDNAGRREQPTGSKRADQMK